MWRFTIANFVVFVVYVYTVFSGDRTALLLTPGMGICKSAMVRRRDTNRWWQQVTVPNLPKPIPQYPPLTLRYGYLRCIPPRMQHLHTEYKWELVPLFVKVHHKNEKRQKVTIPP